MINQDVLNELKIPVKIYFWDEIGLKWTIGSEDVESDRQKNKHQRIEKKCSIKAWSYVKKTPNQSQDRWFIAKLS